MTGNVDSRVVEMHFDNSDFMDKIEETIDALDRLNEKISSINQAQGLMNLTSGSDVSLGNLENSLGNIESRFSILGIAGMTIIQRLTNAAIDGIIKVKNILGAAYAQAKQGGFIRAKNIEQAKFLLEGLGADVESVFGHVDSAVQGTAYGIDEAARAAASFYASGITNGDKLEHSLRAVAGVAAMTGSDFASIADIFTTVAGQGKVMTMQLRMMEGRGLNAAATMAKYFSGVNDGSIEASDSIKKSVKELTGSTKVSEEAVREFVNKGKIDFEVFSAAMDNAFGEHAKEANKTFSGSLANLKTALSRLGEAFYTPAMKAAIPVFNSLRESISKFTNELKKSKVVQEVDKITSSIEKIGKVSRDNIGSLSKLTGKNIEYFDQALMDYFIDVSDGSKKSSKEVKELADSITGSEKPFDELYKRIDNGEITFEIFSAALGNTLKEFRNFNNISSTVQAFSNSIQALGASLSSAIRKFNESEIIGNVAQIIYNSFRIIKTVLGTVRESFKEVFPKSAIDSFEKFTEKLEKSTKDFADFLLTSKQLKAFGNIMVGVFSGFKAAYNILSGIINLLTSLGSAIFGLGGRLSDVSLIFRNFMQGLDEKTGTIGFFDKLSSIIDGIAKTASKAFDYIANGIKKVITTLAEALGDIENLNQAFVAFGLLIGGLELAKNINIWKYRIGNLRKHINDFFGTLSAADIKDAGKTVKASLEQLKRMLVAMTKEVEFKVIRNIALSVLALAVALKLLETIDAGKLSSSLAAVTVLIGEMAGVLFVLLGTLNKSSLTRSLKGVLAIGSVSNALLKIAGAVLLMAVALKMIAELKPSELAKGLIGISVMLGAVLAFVLVLSKYQKVAMDKTVGLIVLSIAASLLIMAKAVQMLAILNPKELAKGLSSIVVLMAAIFGFMAGLSALSVGGSAGMIAAGIGIIAIATAMNILAPALQKIGSMPLNEIAKGLLAIIIALAAMSGASLITNIQGAAGLLLLSVALAGLATALQRLGAMKVSEIAKGLITIVTLLAAFGAAAIILEPVIPVMYALGASMLMLSASVAILGAGLVLIGAGLTSISSGLMSFASVSVTAIQVFIEAIKAAIIAFLNALPEIVNAAIESVLGVFNVLLDHAPEIASVITGLLDVILQVLNENAARIVDFVANFAVHFISTFLEAISGQISNIASTAAEVVANFIQGIADNLDSVIQSGINLILAFINGLANGIRDNAEAVREAIINLCTAILEAFMTFFGIASPSKVMEAQGVNLIEGLIAGIGNSIGRVGEALIEGIKNLPGKVAKYSGKMLSSGKTMITNFLSGLGDKKEKIKKKFTDGVEAAKKKLADSSLYSTGKNLIQGFLNGLNALKDKVTSFWNWLCDKAASIVKKKNEISSPSKLYYRYGKYIMQGFINGLDELKHKPVDTLDKLSDSMAKIDFSLNDDFNPTITPVLDLSDVRKNAGEIDYILGNHTLSMAYSANRAYEQNNQAMQYNMMNKLLNKLDEISKNNNNTSNMVNNISVEGSTNPEDFANQLLNSFKMRMRTV